MNNKWIKNQWVKCIKQYGDSDCEYGVDFYKGELYQIQDVAYDEVYIYSSENGTEAMLFVTDMDDYFTVV